MSSNAMTILPGTERAVIVAIQPEIDGGRYPIKRIVGDRVAIEATVVADGHDFLQCVLLTRRKDEKNWREIPMAASPNDKWRAEFTVEKAGLYFYTVEAWVDGFLTWRRDLKKRADAQQVTPLDLLSGAALAREAGDRATGDDADKIRGISALLSDPDEALEKRTLRALSEDFLTLMMRHSDRHAAKKYERELAVTVDRKQAAFGAWYEFFPRSCSASPIIHGTFNQAESFLPTVSMMGFDFVYLPPVHPIGETHRKGVNNASISKPTDVGSPWAIGNREGGHKSLHPQLGNMDDFRHFIQAAKSNGLEVAMDVAFQCSPDHPYVREHPNWFRKRPDGSIQYAENPPKKYEDIYPFDFESAESPALWNELKSVVDFWGAQGVRAFRVDNPHTKPLAFWEWLIAEVKKKDPEVIFLAEAFTRPALMYQLAKVGFTQSYNYFPWKNQKIEIETYFTELTGSGVLEYFRSNLWPNTPDILTEYLQTGGRPAFVIRLILAAALGANYGIYGPAFEVCENRAREKGGEEYLRSEKYEIKHWEAGEDRDLRALIRRINLIRRSNAALQQDKNLRFHNAENESLICFTKESADRSNLVIGVVNLDPHHTQAGVVALPLNDFKLPSGGSRFKVTDLLNDMGYLWQGSRNFVELDPSVMPAHLFVVER